MKNYQKIYNRLIKELKNELDTHYKYLEQSCDDSPSGLAEQIENKYGIAILEWFLSTLDEIEGKKCSYILMNENEFKQWQKRIKT